MSLYIQGDQKWTFFAIPSSHPVYNLKLSTAALTWFVLFNLYRSGIYQDRWFYVENSGHHSRLLRAPVHLEISSQKILAYVVSEIKLRNVPVIYMNKCWYVSSVAVFEI